MTTPTQAPDHCPATLEPEPPNAPDTCPACGARKRIDSGEFVHYACGVCYWRPGRKVVSDLYDDHVAAVALRAERDAALARAEKAEAQRDVYTGLYLFANQQHEQQEIELQRYKKIMPCGHARMLEVLNDGQMPECSVCWLERVEDERNALTARLSELQATLEYALSWIDDDFKQELSEGDTVRHAINRILAALASGAESEMTK